MVSTIFIIIIYLAFVSLGLPDTSFGVAWPSMRLDFNMPLDAAGIVTIVVTIFSAISGFLNGKLLKKFGCGLVTATSCLITALAMVGYAFSSNYIFIVLCAIPLGFGAGAVDAGLNNYVAENLSSRHMNWLHCCWGVGATISPIIMANAIAITKNWRMGYLTIAIIQILLAALLFATLKMWKNSGARTEEKIIKDSSVPNLAPVLSVLSYVVYVGIEGSVGLWLNSLLVEYRGVAVGTAGVLVSVYFGSIMTGRFLSGFISNRLGNRKLTRIGLFVALVGGILFFFKDAPMLYTLGIVFIGLGFAPFYPSQMHEAARRYGSDLSAKIVGYQVGASYISGIVMAPLVGLIGARFSLEILCYFIVGFVLLLNLIVNKLDKIS